MRATTHPPRGSSQVSGAVRSLQRALGAYYTPELAADLMANWILRTAHDRVLEPSMGDGVFLRSIQRAVADRGLGGARVFGVELSDEAFSAVLEEGLIERESAIRSDFLQVSPFEVDAVIGNPPYVRLRHLPPAQRTRALAVAKRELGREMDPSGSVWMPFVLHATRFIRESGRLALVLPYDFTYVRYAQPLWRFLSREYGSLRLVRVHERLFDDLLQEVVLLFCDERGGSTDVVQFEAHERTSDLLESNPVSTAEIAIDEIAGGGRPFIEALLPQPLRDLLHGRLARLTIPVGHLARVRIGYVTGDKRFFHPPAHEVEAHELPAGSLRPTVTSARQVRGAGIYTSGLSDDSRSSLFLPPGGPLSRGEAAYVAEGERLGVDQRYKCRVRQPWWIVPQVERPDVIISVFSEDPLMLVNDDGLHASNSLLCLYLGPHAIPSKLVASWYTPLTALQRELNVHSLGGGVFVMVPNEVSRVRVPVIQGDMPLADLDEAVRCSDLSAAYEWGSAHVLKNKLGLSKSELDLIDDGRERLAHWRRSASTA